MIWRSKSSNWQTVIADLSLILFLVAAFALGKTGETPPAADQSSSGDKAREGVPISVWRDGPDAIAPYAWLTEQLPDNAARPNMMVRYRDGEFENAWHRASKIRAQLGPSGENMRILLQPAQYDSVEIYLQHDRASSETGPIIAW